MIAGPVRGKLQLHPKAARQCKTAKQPYRRSSQVQRVLFQIGERTIGQRPFVRSAQHHPWRPARFQRFLPAWHTQAPPVAGFETGKPKVRHRRRQIIAARPGKLQKFVGDYYANGMAAGVLPDPYRGSRS